nr:HAMP domain-containing sensor histidine kinase [Arthrobacter sp. H14-L1]
MRTKMVLATMALLTAICLIVGSVSYAAVQSSLMHQLDTTLNEASHRAVVFSSGAPPRGSSGSRPNPLNARGTGIGTLNARVSGGTVTSAGLLANDQTLTGITPDDAQTLRTVAVGAAPVDRTLSSGEYRLTAIRVPDGDVVVTGLPLAANNAILASLVLAIVLISLGGLAAVGLVGTVIIRRTLAPLEELSAVAGRVAELPLEAGEVALTERVPLDAANPATEVGNVGHALNKLLDNVFSALVARQRSETKVRRFVADASHELRTPLTAIRGYTELLRATETLSAEGMNSLDRVESQSRRMGTLVEDLLLLARLDEGLPLASHEVDLTEVVVECVSDLRVMANDHRWQLDIPSEPLNICADETQLRQLLTNLLSNAVKHTAAGSTICTRLQRSAVGAVILTVADDGPGIPAEFQDKVFDRFARADLARAGSTGSTGLGLAIVQAIAHAHGGRVELRSRPGRTSFIVHLPQRLVVP